MSINNFFELSLLNKSKLTCSMIEAHKVDLLENLKKFEEMLKVPHTHTLTLNILCIGN